MSMLSKLKQFKDLREQGKKFQSVMSGESVTARAFGDKVVLIMDGNMQISGLTIDPSALSPENKTKLEEGIKDAFNDAFKKMQRVMAGKMQEMGGMEGVMGK